MSASVVGSWTTPERMTSTRRRLAFGVALARHERRTRHRVPAQKGVQRGDGLASSPTAPASRVRTALLQVASRPGARPRCCSVTGDAAARCRRQLRRSPSTIGDAAGWACSVAASLAIRRFRRRDFRSMTKAPTSGCASRLPTARRVVDVAAVGAAHRRLALRAARKAVDHHAACMRPALRCRPARARCGGPGRCGRIRPCGAGANCRPGPRPRRGRHSCGRSAAAAAFPCRPRVAMRIGCTSRRRRQLGCSCRCSSSPMSWRMGLPGRGAERLQPSQPNSASCTCMG